MSLLNTRAVQFFRSNLIYLRLIFFYSFVFRLAMIFIFWGSVLDYFDSTSWVVRLGHYFAIYFFVGLAVLSFKNFSSYLFFRSIRAILFFSVRFPFLHKLNRYWLHLTSRLMMLFVRVISFNYFLATAFFFLASFYRLELVFELVFLALFFRIVYNLLILGPRFLVPEEALKFYQRVSLGREPGLSNAVDRGKLVTVPAPAEAFAYSANIVVFRPFLYGFTRIIRYVIHNFIKFEDYREPHFYAGHFVFPLFRLMPGFLLHQDPDFSIAYFYVLTFDLLEQKF